MPQPLLMLVLLPLPWGCLAGRGDETGIEMIPNTSRTRTGRLRGALTHPEHNHPMTMEPIAVGAVRAADVTQRKAGRFCCRPWRE